MLIFLGPRLMALPIEYEDKIKFTNKPWKALWHCD